MAGRFNRYFLYHRKIMGIQPINNSEHGQVGIQYAELATHLLILSVVIPILTIKAQPLCESCLGSDAGGQANYILIYRNINAVQEPPVRPGMGPD